MESLSWALVRVVVVVARHRLALPRQDNAGFPPPAVISLKADGGFQYPESKPDILNCNKRFDDASPSPFGLTAA
jgi:hypothetical protein